ncbi:replication initiation protein [Pseudomonas syringae]|uniref:replication initiation protein n=1 Tax=Pseudomonas syringae TaxID=317 RepID=UPI00020959C6|nr:replication initiation protein [Pseudomonas syringae]EPM92108.1 replication protein RepA [Pseudomonas syringae pv. actinidiae ICMP 19070]AQL40748.1 replication protein A [Pseudomonas syringae pv. actinidiae ICMP 9853]EGH68672.1 replication protein RepA [Pseudomonas syringae pv. actinidiae str. M302091]EPM53520.1 replication protein RepA [Pseudomonas syringae pv. actinidiae ICMP 19071]EPM74037.1 replication protein RepA [Pseudomonas syringae pv. actinidiae ICMP 19072]
MSPDNALSLSLASSHTANADPLASSTHLPPARFFEDGTALNRLLLEAPYMARCSDDKTATRVRPREYALRYPYMQVNRPGMVSWLVFDLDHANALAWDDAGLPAPNLMVRNRKSGHSQLFYAVPSVCTTENARAKPIQYMKAIYAAFAARLDADVDYHGGPVAKTPGHPWWETTEFHSHVYELGELASAVELTVKPWATGPKLDQVSHSRHCILFEQLRYFAYSIVNRERELGSFESFMRSLDAYAYNHNSFLKQGFSENLPLSSIRATVKSVGRWTWDRYTGDRRCHRGAMQLDGSLSLTERQSLAAKRTHELRHKATESKIRAACRQLQDQGKALVRSAIATLAGVSVRTVASYTHILTEVSQPATVSVLKVSRKAVPIQPKQDRSPATPPVQAPGGQLADGRASGVQYGVHQISAVPQGPQPGGPLKTEHEDGS